MFELAEHDGTPEHEIAQSIRNAERLLRKHNIKREDIEEMAENLDLMDVDVVKVYFQYVRNGNTGKRVPMMEWFFRLAEALTLNFGVKYCFSRTGISYFKFYGLKNNSQMAAYMYKCVFNQIHLLAKAYKPDEGNDEVRKVMKEASTKTAFARQMRLSYALGICLKLITNIKKKQKEQEPKKKARREARESKLEKALNPGDERVPGKKNSKDGVDDDGDDGVDALSDISSSDSDSLSVYQEEEDIEKEQVLTVVQQNGHEQALKKPGFTLRQRSERSSTQNVLSVAVKAGKNDARKIDLNRRQIAN